MNGILVDSNSGKETVSDVFGIHDEEVLNKQV